MHRHHINMYEAVQAYTHNTISMQLQKVQMKARITASFKCIHLHVHLFFGIFVWLLVCVCACACVFTNRDSIMIELQTKYD